ncbi:hypothetical protein [Marinomonas transparens]|uniref:Outer membrane protein beta-barrel domain-containing protein n=1 Tax=Marinomonas transparens TaxID=2795388 RepID=A0A934MY23_9GAMM|nr:hypothetical protein [Marinomonas transparens]MBJ7539949.1 hypothetical protein [Marinomonas transparens]
MTLFSRILLVVAFCSGFVQAQESMDGKETAKENKDDQANFEFGLGYGLANEKSLLNIDFKINIPLSERYSTQVLLNSNYFITGSSEDSFAQSELSSNWFARYGYGRLGVGIGIGELEPKNKSKETDRAVIGRFMGDLYLGAFTLISNYASYDRNLSNVSSTRLGLSYYLDDDMRVSLYREKFSNFGNGWRLETYFQPEKYEQKGSLGLIVRTGDEYDYAGVVVQYYFDKRISLKQRERTY